MSNEVMTFDANNMLMNPQVMNAMSVLADTMSKGSIMTPEHLRGKPADCMAVIMQAARWKMDPFVVAGKTFPIKGRLGYESQLIVAAMQSTGAVKSRFHYEYGGNWPNGNDAWVRCGAILSGEDAIQWGEPLYIAKVSVKNSPLWKDDPKQQGAYLATKRWSRLYAPGAVLGVYSNDELEDYPEKDVTPQPTVETGNDVLDSIIGEIEQETNELSELDFALLSDKILQASNMIEFADAMEEVSKVDNATDKQLAELRATAKKKKAELAKPKPQDIEF